MLDFGHLRKGGGGKVFSSCLGMEPSSKQWVVARGCCCPQAFQEVGFVLNADVQKLAAEKFSGVLATQISEDVHNHQKNASVIKGKKKYRRPEKAMGAALARKVLTCKHHYREPCLDVPLPQKSLRLPKSHFVPQKGLLSMKFGDVASTSAKTSWYSPSPANWGQRDSDLELLRVAKQKGFAVLDTSWLGSVIVGHKLLIRKLGEQQWWFPRLHHPDSSVLALPARTGVLPQSSMRWWGPDVVSIKAYAYLCVSDLHEWEAVHYEWRCPAWQRARCQAMSGEPGALLCFSSHGPRPLLQVMACATVWGGEASPLFKLGESVLEPREPGHMTVCFWTKNLQLAKS